MTSFSFAEAPLEHHSRLEPIQTRSAHRKESPRAKSGAPGPPIGTPKTRSNSIHTSRAQNALLDASVGMRPELIDFLRQDAHATSPPETLSGVEALAHRQEPVPAQAGGKR
jgi:hypothetical protein